MTTIEARVDIGKPYETDFPESACIGFGLDEERKAWRLFMWMRGKDKYWLPLDGCDKIVAQFMSIPEARAKQIIDTVMQLGKPEKYRKNAIAYLTITDCE